MDLLTVTLDNAQRLLLLAIPALLGFVVGRVGLFEDNDRAVKVLNVFALYVGFPALVFRGVVDDSFALPTDLGFWFAVPIAHLLAVGLLALWRPKQVRGTLALVALFGNVAYLGLPLVVGIFGESVAGRAALLVAIHVAISVSVGPYLLQRWSGGHASIDLKKLAMQPLLWAPVVGLGARFLPETARGGLELAVTPLAAAAAPVALFLLGLYVWIKRDLIVGGVPTSWLHIGTRMLVVPAATAAVCLVLREFGLLGGADASLLIVLSGMPAAITTFSIAHDAQIGDEVVASTIVRTTVLSIVSLPLLAAAARLI